MTEGKLNIKNTALLSFGFLATSLAWSLYNSMVPQILNTFTASATLIAAIMVLDNITGVVLEPLFGFFSDRTRTRFGRRMPYMMVGVPVCAVALILVPHMHTLWPLIAMLVVFCVVMAMWRTPVISLMPDLTPGPLRSQANGIVNMAGGVGSLIAFVAGGILLNLGGFPLPFLVGALVMLVALFILVAFVREPKSAFVPEVKQARVKLAPSERNSLLLILSAIFFWFLGYNAVETFFTLYATTTLNASKGDATILLGVFSVAFIAFAVPAGFIGAKIGRRKTIMIGLVAVTVFFIPMVIGSTLVGTIVCLFGGGLAWACININSLPMVVRLAGEHQVGTFTGYYYLFSVAAQIVGPLVAGVLIDYAGAHQLLFIPTADHYRALFLFAAAGFVIALVILVFVRHGEDVAPAQTPTQPTQPQEMEASGL